MHQDRSQPHGRCRKQGTQPEGHVEIACNVGKISGYGRAGDLAGSEDRAMNPKAFAALLEQQYCAPWSVTPGIVSAILYISLGASLAAFFLWNSAVTVIGPATSSLFQYFLPVFSGMAAYLILGQPITIPHAIGIFLIMTGVVLATRPR